MKKLLLMFGLSLLGIVNMQANEKFTLIGQKCLGTGMSPNGKYVVGIDPSIHVTDYYIESYLFNTETGQHQWLTEYDETDPGKGGHFTDVTDNGVIAGSFRNPDYQITIQTPQGSTTFPINVAAIWKDGRVTSLGIGSFKLSEFTQLHDGSFANAISNDGSTVVGRIGLRNAFSFPCMWKFDRSKENWSYSALSLPENAVGGRATDVSADGSIVVGTVWYKTSESAAYWQNGECHLLEGTGEDTQYNGGNYRNRAYTISPNGKYIAFAFNSGRVPAVFDIKNQTYVKPDTYLRTSGVEGIAIANNGNIVSAYSFGDLLAGKIYYRPIWYYYKEKRTFGFDYFMNLFAPSIKSPFTFLYEEETKAIPCAVSADGTVVMGNDNTIMPLGGVPENWVLHTNEQNIAIPEALEYVQAKTLNLKEVTVLWKKEKHPHEGLTLQSYAIYCDGKKIADVPEEGKDTATYVQKNTLPGFPKYSVASVFKINTSGSLIESPKSEPIAIAVSDTYSLPLYEDFDSGSTEANYWTKEIPVDQLIDSDWSFLEFSGIVDKGLYTSCITGQPYSSTIISRPMDATNNKNVRFSFATRYRLINSNDQPLDRDTLSIDITVDKGSNWTEVKSFTLSGLSRFWNFQNIDLSQWVSGKLFQVRLRKHGQGTMYGLLIDILKVGTEAEKEAPEGLEGSSDKQKFELIWRNSYGAHQLNYVTNDFSGFALGDEGKPFIAANLFEAKDLEIYKGKYLTSVKAYVNHSAIEDSKDTHASVVVFEDGRLIREQEMESIAYNEDNIVVLNEPVLIDASKELKIGMKIFEYDERQIPITYQNTTDFIAGKSDLYSQDNGKTWQKLSDFYANIEGKETQGYCSWKISGGVTDEQTVAAEPEEDPDLYAYNVFRNGEQINKNLICSQQTHFTDTKPLDQKASYEIVAYYLNGSVSDASNAVLLGGEGSVDNMQTDSRVIVFPNPATDHITLNGEFNQATLFTLKGETIIITQSNRIDLSRLTEGVYLLKVESQDCVENHKVMIKR